jgi:hypothetical protein
MDEVHVHYHSPYPARLRAHAYTQGTHIYMGQGQEKHLAHEAWHVVQQMQGRVKPTTRVAATKINDDEALEREADRQGQRASTFPAPTLSAHRHLSGPLADPQSITSPPATVHLPGEPIIQRMRFEEVVAGYYYLVLVNGKKQELFLESKNDEGPAKFVFIDSSGNYILIENEDSIIEYVKEPGDREKSTEEITYLDEQYMTDRDETFNEASTLSGPQIYQEMFMEEEKKEETDSEAREDIGQAADISSLGLATWNVAHLSTHIITNKLKRLQDHLTKFSQSAPSWRALIKFVKNLLLAYDRALQQQQQQQQETEDQWSEENQPDEYVSSPKKKRQSTTKKKRASTKKKTSYDIEGEYPSSDAEYQDNKE